MILRPATVAALAAIGLAVAGVAVWKLTRPGAMQNATAGAVSGAIGLAGEAASGAVLGIGDAVGLQRTDMSECERAIAEGRTWDASFACPAGTFIKSLWN